MKALKCGRAGQVLTTGWIFCPVLAALVMGCGAAAGSLVYDNSIRDANRAYGVGGIEFGDQIHLGGTERTLNRFVFEYHLSENASGNETMQVAFYANDGPLITRTNFDGTTFEGRAPGTILYSSPEVKALAGWWVVDWSGASILVPDTFTWTVRFGGIEEGEEGGLPIYDMPAAGWSESDFWQQGADGAWASRELSDPAMACDFAARVFASTSPITVSKDRQGQLTVTVVRPSSPQYLKRATSPQGPWTDWQLVPPRSVPGETLTYTNTAAGDGAFFSWGNGFE